MSTHEKRAQSVAHHLLQGKKSLEGARVALLIQPGEEFIAGFFGVQLAGGCAVVLSPLHPVNESSYFCMDSEAIALLVSSAWREQAVTIAPGLPLHAIEEIPDSAVDTHFAQTDQNAPALQLYTSGTTGKPKGAVLTRANLAVQQKLLKDAWGLSDRDTLLHVLPLHHMHGLCIALLSVLGAGGKILFVPKFDARRIWELMADSTVFMAVPTIYSKLFEAFDAANPTDRERWARNATSLRLATSGSAALPVTLAQRWRELTGRIPLERFGMTEVGVALSNPLSGERKPGSVGLPLPSVLTRIVDDELWIAGPSVFSEYYRKEEATRNAFTEVDGIRYFRTGDTVTRDDDGYFRILGRTSVDILKSGGYKLSALEIEESLREHPHVAEVAVVGAPDEVWGEKVVACIVSKKGASLNEASLREFAKTRMAGYKVPKHFFFVEELPRNAMGKVIKPELLRKVIHDFLSVL